MSIRYMGLKRTKRNFRLSVRVVPNMNLRVDMEANDVGWMTRGKVGSRARRELDNLPRLSIIQIVFLFRQELEVEHYPD